MGTQLKILALGDVVGEPGRRLVEEFVPSLRRETGADLVVINGENAAHGHGITEAIARQWFDNLGVDVITTGNHAFDVKGIESTFRQEPRLIAEVLVINLMGRVHMSPCDCPFRCVDSILQKERADLVLVDMHAEATSEAQAMGYYLAGRAAAVLGTHTHVPTLDAKVLPGGTAYVTDIGMTGPYDGVIGMKKECSLGRFLNVQRPRYEVATGDAQLHAVLITTDGRQAVSIERILRTL